MVELKTRVLLYLNVLLLVFITGNIEFTALATTQSSYVIYNKQSKKVLDIGKNVILNWKKVDDIDASITYSGSWGTFTGNLGYNKTEHFSSSKGASAKFTFTGVQARYYGYLRNDLDIAEVRIDGKFVTKVNCYNGNKFDALLYVLYNKV